MTYIVSALAFIVLLTFLILIHELGHYLAARLFGVDVEEFGFGFPPKARRLFRRWGTDFTLNWIPFGGFVRLKGENAVDLDSRFAPHSFARAAGWQRIIILCGGVFMNFILAFALLTVGFSVGRWVPNFYSSIEELEKASSRGEVSVTFGVYRHDGLPGSPAAEGGITKASIIDSVNGVHVSRPDDVIAIQKTAKRATYVLLDPESRTPSTVKLTLKDGKSGIAISPYPASLSAPRRSVATGIVLALRETQFMTVQTVKGIGALVRSLVTRGHVPEGITGIVGIAVLTYGSVQEGFMTYLRLVALLSLSLAILNILPLPSLDGGRLLFVIAEMAMRRTLNHRIELLTNTIGFFLLIGLIVIITFNDVIHLF